MKKRVALVGLVAILSPLALTGCSSEQPEYPSLSNTTTVEPPKNKVEERLSYHLLGTPGVLKWDNGVEVSVAEGGEPWTKIYPSNVRVEGGSRAESKLKLVKPQEGTGWQLKDQCMPMVFTVTNKGSRNINMVDTWVHVQALHMVTYQQEMEFIPMEGSQDFKELPPGTSMTMKRCYLVNSMVNNLDLGYGVGLIDFNRTSEADRLVPLTMFADQATFDYAGVRVENK